MERFFKIGILILGILFLILFYQYSQNGRYNYYGQGAEEIGMLHKILDTRTGKVYQYILPIEKDAPILWIVYDPITGTMTIKNNQRIDLRKK